MRCNLSFEEAFKSEMSSSFFPSLSLPCHPLLSERSNDIKDDNEEVWRHNDKYIFFSVERGSDHANCLPTWWWLNVSLSRFFIPLCHCGCLLSSTLPPPFFCLPPFCLIFSPLAPSFKPLLKFKAVHFLRMNFGRDCPSSYLPLLKSLVCYGVVVKYKIAASKWFSGMI